MAVAQNWKDIHRLVELRKVPLTDTGVRERLESGALLRLTAEVAVPCSYFQELSPWGKAEAQAAAVGLTADKAVVSGMAAGRLWGLKLLGVEKTVDLHLPGSARPPARRLWIAGTTYRSAALPADQVTTKGGIRVTTLLRTLSDISRRETQMETVAAIDSARMTWSAFTPVKIHERLRTMGAFPGIRAFREAIGLSRPDIGSPWETKARLLLQRCGDPAITSIETQVRFLDSDTGATYFVDILINGWLILEVDGRAKYLGVYGEDPGVVIRGEREREKALQNLGPVVLRVGKEHMEERGDGHCVMVQMVLRGLRNFTPPTHLSN